MRFNTVRALALLISTAMVAGCDRDSLLSSSQSMPEAMRAAMAMDTAAFEIPVPQSQQVSFSPPVQSGLGNVPWMSTGISVAANTPTPVRIRGLLRLAVHPDMADACANGVPGAGPLYGHVPPEVCASPYLDRDIGPLGFNGREGSPGELGISLRVNAGGVYYPVNIWPVYGDLATAQGVIRVPVGGTLEVMRRQLYGSHYSFICAIEPTCVFEWSTPIYAPSGSQVLEVEQPRTGPRLICPPDTERGQTAGCSVSGDGVQVLGWEWISDTFMDDPSARVQEASTATEWRGQVVESGTVKARVLYEGVERTLEADLKVRGRVNGWRWGRPQWGFVHADPARVCDDERPATTKSYLIGWNVNSASCKAELSLRVQPDPSRKPREGHTLAVVPSGPNRGRWYVSGVSYRMDRSTGLNPSILPTGRKYRLRGSQAAVCRSAMGLPANENVEVNYYIFNKQCMGVDVDAMLVGAWGHEEYGANGGAGHQGVAELEAAVLDNDPYFNVEGIVLGSEKALRAAVNSSAYGAGSRITDLASDRSGRVTGNYPSSTHWVWDPGSREYVSTTLRAF